MTQDAGTIWLTQDAFDKLNTDLDDLKGPRRAEIIEKISAARDEGDTLAVYSPQSAMGAAINGHDKGETVTYTAPNGKEIQVDIVDAEPYRS